jgi:hypothetical protein
MASAIAQTLGDSASTFEIGGGDGDEVLAEIEAEIVDADVVDIPHIALEAVRPAAATGEKAVHGHGRPQCADPLSRWREIVAAWDRRAVGCREDNCCPRTRVAT